MTYPDTFVKERFFFFLSIISELIETTVAEKMNDAKDESVEAVFLSILRQKDLDMRDKKAAIVDFIAAGIHTVRRLCCTIILAIMRGSKKFPRLFKKFLLVLILICSIQSTGRYRGLPQIILISTTLVPKIFFTVIVSPITQKMFENLKFLRIDP